MEKIAIVGLSCLFPDAATPQEYWQNLLEQKDSRSAATAAQMGVDADIFFAENKGVQDKYYCLNGGYIRDFEFDGEGFRVSAEKIRNLDKLFQWPLYVAAEALHDYGIRNTEYATPTPELERCGIVLGNLSFPTQKSHGLFESIYRNALEGAFEELLDGNELPLVALDSQEVDPDNLKVAGYPATFVAEALGLGGTNFALDAACASSLYAVKLASQYLLSGKADLMLAGAVSRADPFFINMGFSIFRAYPEGEAGSQPLNQGSGGLYAGEGAGMFVLKRHSDAVRDGDKIYAVISGVGLSNDGKGKFLLQPNPKGQVLAFERAYAEADLNPAQIDYVECHATGTPVGDITELNSMEAFYGKYSDEMPLIGSAKSNFGHLLTAAGMAGMTKVILGMAQNQIPATINLTEPLESKEGTVGSEQIVQQTIKWPRKNEVDRAAVSAFGFGGTNAHLILEQTAPRTTHHAPRTTQSQKMAIVGMDAFFGSADGLAAFGRKIHNNEQDFRPIPKGRWQGIENEPAILREHGFADGTAPDGAYITDFDMDFFHYKIPANNDTPIPQQLLILKVADRALKDAGIAEGSNVAVIIGMSAELALHRFRGRVDLTWQIRESLAQSGIDLTAEQEMQLEAIAKQAMHEPAQINQYVSFIGNIMASRISALWDFSGPSFTLSAEENATFKALEVAQTFLAAGEVDAVVVGAVDFAGGLENVLLRNQQNPVNDGAATLSFDAKASGWQVGEGAGCIVLKRETDAADDRVYATIDAVSIVAGTDGKTAADGVVESCQSAFAEKGIAPTDVGYLEVHGSGFAAEDAAEVAGLTQVYGKSEKPTTAIGSVKANYGHTFAASGVASLIKTAHALHHRYIPPVPNWHKPKQFSAFKDSPFYVAPYAQPWLLESGKTQRIAAVNGMGSDGAFVHILMSDSRATAPHTSDNPLLTGAGIQLFPLRAESEAGLQAQLARLEDAFAENGTITSIASRNFAAFERSSGAYTVGLVGENSADILREIKRAKAGLPHAFATNTVWKTPNGSYFTPKPLRGDVTFVYPGAFSAYAGLGRNLFQLFPELHAEFAEVVEKSAELVGTERLYPRSMESWNDMQHALYMLQLMEDAITMLQTGATYSTLITKVVRDKFGIQPKAALGYSLGVLTMLYSTGIWSVADNASDRLQASPIFKRRLSGALEAVREYWDLPADTKEPIWSIFMLKANAEQVRTAIADSDRVFLTHINTENEVVIGGEPTACKAIIAELGCDSVQSPYNHVIHCPPAEIEYDALFAINQMAISEQPEIRLYFDEHGAQRDLTTQSAAKRITDVTTQQVNFPALVQAAHDDGSRIFVELGPRSACTWWIRDILQGQEFLAVGVNRRSKDDRTGLVLALAQLVSHGVSADLSSLYAPLPATKTKAKSLIRTVSLLNTPIREAILTPENRANFQNIKLKAVAVSEPATIIPVRTPLPLPPVTLPKLPQPIEIMPTKIESAIQSSNGHSNGYHTEPAQHTNDQQLATSNFLLDQLEAIAANNAAANRVHEQFLRERSVGIERMGALIRGKVVDGEVTREERVVREEKALSREIPPQDPNRPNNYTTPDQVIWDRADLEQYASGSIVPMFGEEYAVIDTYGRRVRLPMPPYLLVDRVTKLDAKVHEYKPSTMTTEYDIPFDAWYSTDGQIPWAVSVESGQCDLLLISYMGIDFQNKGERVYRLLDCTLTFLDDMPMEGHTLRYDIKINSFARNGGALIFFFEYNCFVGDKMVLKMRNGCAGFFSDEELAGGKGIIHTQKELEAKRNTPKRYFAPPLTCNRNQFSRAELLELTAGNIASVFGADYEQNGKNPSLHLPLEEMMMIDGIAEIDPQGGAWGLGLIISEIDLEPDDWFFPCHFKDDEVMAGSLVAEGCGQLLQFYLLYLGMQVHTEDARFQPIQGLPQIVRTRKQIMAEKGKLVYRMEIKDVGLEPRPFAIADVDIIYNGTVVVDFKDLGLQLKEK